MNYAPTRKVMAGPPIYGFAGAIIWLVRSVWGLDMPAEVAVVIVGCAASVVQYLVADLKKS